jgi:hypothetical protein
VLLFAFESIQCSAMSGVDDATSVPTDNELVSSDAATMTELPAVSTDHSTTDCHHTHVYIYTDTA